jgi:hypothetical protein
MSIFQTRIIFGISLGEILFVILLALFSIGGGILTCCDTDGTGVIASLPMLACFLFSMKNSFFTVFLGITFERQLIWHKVTAVLTVGLGIYHGVVSLDDPEEELSIDGIILVAVMGVMVIFGWGIIRRKWFEFFFRFHWILFIFAFLYSF